MPSFFVTIFDVCETGVEEGGVEANTAIRLVRAQREWFQYILLCNGMVKAHKTDSYAAQLRAANDE